MNAHLYDILRTASSRAETASVAAAKHSAVNRVQLPIDEHAVDAAIATLPDAAEKGARSAGPEIHNGYFLLAEWTPGDLRAVALYEAVATKLKGLGIVTAFSNTDLFFKKVPYRIYVAFASLHAVAAEQIIRRGTWLEEVRALWLARAGAGAETKVMTTADIEHVVLTAAEATADPTDRRPAHLRVLEHRVRFDADKPAPAVISEAVAALHLPAWTFEAVVAAWKVKTGGEVIRSKGLWKGTAVRPVPTLIFKGAPGGAAAARGVEVTLAVEDVHALTPGAIAEQAASEMSAALFEAEAKGAPSTAPAVPPPPAQETPAPTRKPFGGAQGRPFTSAAIMLDVPFTDHEKAAADAKAAFPKSVQIPGGVVRVVKDPEEGVAYKIETEVDGAVVISGNAADAVEGADTLGLFVEDAWKEAAEKQARDEEVAPMGGAAGAGKGASKAAKKQATGAVVR